jgi:hypothetical protein
VAYGQYLVRVASCSDCHTQIDNRGQPLPGMAFAGGNQFRDPDNGYRVRSANITPDADTGIGTWTGSSSISSPSGTDDHVLTDASRRQNTPCPGGCTPA